MERRPFKHGFELRERQKLRIFHTEGMRKVPWVLEERKFSTAEHFRRLGQRFAFDRATWPRPNDTPLTIHTDETKQAKALMTLIYSIANGISPYKRHMGISGYFIRKMIIGLH